MRIVFKPFETVTLRRMIADRMEEAILNGTLREGERLVERRLASQFGTSLTAVREALIALEA
ncbi:MAG: GntR family transcriptional regulator, partial [Terriglobia bacterium]